MEFTSVTPVVLGILDLGPRSGYDIKRLVDNSTRFFWGASYGQIYPELRRLAKAGLVKGESAPRGARPRTVYRLTPKGRRALREWLLSPGVDWDIKDEGFLKLFFAGALDRDDALELVRRLRERHERDLERLSAVEPHAKGRGGFPYLVLQWGMGLNRWTADWCAQVERSLAEEDKERTGYAESPR
jgi:PadR family transcriptional regulator, regulatory protein AphA